MLFLCWDLAKGGILEVVLDYARTIRNANKWKTRISDPKFIGFSLFFSLPSFLPFFSLFFFSGERNDRMDGSRRTIKNNVK